MKALLQRFVPFALLGLVGTAVHFAVLSAGVWWWQRDPVTASCFGALAGALTNYTLNYHLNYRSRSPHAQTLSRFLLVAATGFVLNGLLMAQFTARLGPHFLIAQALSTGLVLAWNFAANNFWTFRRGAPVSPPSRAAVEVDKAQW